MEATTANSSHQRPSRELFANTALDVFMCRCSRAKQISECRLLNFDQIEATVSNLRKKGYVINLSGGCATSLIERTAKVQRKSP